MKKLPDGRKNRAHPEKPVNWSCGCDPHHAKRPWCQTCTGSKQETFLCRKKALRWFASLSKKEKKKHVEMYGDCMHPDAYC